MVMATSVDRDTGTALPHAEAIPARGLPRGRRVLLVFPRYSPSFGSFDHAFHLVGAKAFMPPQGLLVIAAALPSTWEARFVDENLKAATAADFRWAEVGGCP